MVAKEVRVCGCQGSGSGCQGGEDMWLLRK